MLFPGGNYLRRGHNVALTFGDTVSNAIRLRRAAAGVTNSFLSWKRRCNLGAPVRTIKIKMQKFPTRFALAFGAESLKN